MSIDFVCYIFGSMSHNSFYAEREEVIAMSADTAIVAKGSSVAWMFHPEKGMKICEIICMPRVCD